MYFKQLSLQFNKYTSFSWIVLSFAPKTVRPIVFLTHNHYKNYKWRYMSKTIVYFADNWPYPLKIDSTREWWRQPRYLPRILSRFQVSSSDLEWWNTLRSGTRPRRHGVPDTLTAEVDLFVIYAVQRWTMPAWFILIFINQFKKSNYESRKTLKVQRM